MQARYMQMVVTGVMKDLMCTHIWLKLEFFCVCHLFLSIQIYLIVYFFCFLIFQWFVFATKHLGNIDFFFVFFNFCFWFPPFIFLWMCLNDKNTYIRPKDIIASVFGVFDTACVWRVIFRNQSKQTNSQHKHFWIFFNFWIFELFYFFVSFCFLCNVWQVLMFGLMTVKHTEFWFRFLYGGYFFLYICLILIFKRDYLQTNKTTKKKMDKQIWKQTNTF